MANKTLLQGSNEIIEHKEKIIMCEKHLFEFKVEKNDVNILDKKMTLNHLSCKMGKNRVRKQKV